MNREQAISTYVKPTKYELSTHIIIDSIYDDFESRTCSNCKLSADCYIKDRIFFNGYNTAVQKPYLGNFGCNQFQSANQE